MEHEGGRSNITFRATEEEIGKFMEALPMMEQIEWRVGRVLFAESAEELDKALEGFASLHEKTDFSAIRAYLQTAQLQTVNIYILQRIKWLFGALELAESSLSSLRRRLEEQNGK